MRGGPRGGRGFRGGYAASRGRQVQTAYMRSQFMGQLVTNSARRIQKDLKELEDNKHLLVGVSAEPLPNSIYEIHGNLKGLKGTAWEKMVVHFKMTLPNNYPMGPPSITLSKTLDHPNVFGTKLCLDMLEKPSSNPKIYEGWVPAYTIESILIQLQSFLFEWIWKYDDKKWLLFSANTLKKQIEEQNTVQCKECGHKGALEPHPKPLEQEEEGLKDFIMVKSPKELLKEELSCYFTKSSLKESTLGIGISLKKSVTTTEIKYVNPTLDLISMRAFTKLKIRTSLDATKYTHWLPLYFGEDEEYTIENEEYDHDLDEHVKETRHINVKERFEKLFYNSMAFISNGSKYKPLTPENVLAFFPRLIMTHIVDLTKENRTISIIAIRRLFNFMRLFHILIKKLPKVAEMMDQKLKDFIEDPQKRLKDPDICPNLGDIQVFSIMSQKYSFEDIKEAYVGEQMDRQVFWMLQHVPELDFQNKNIKHKGKVSETKRLKVCFETGKVGAQITTFFHYINDAIKKQNEKQGKSDARWDSLSRLLDSNHGCLDFTFENLLLKNFQFGLKIKSFADYFKNLGIEIKGGDQEIYDKLIQSVKNSRRKGYHNDDLDMVSKLKLPSIPIQSENRTLQLLGSFLDVKVEEETNEPEDKNQIAQDQPHRANMSVLTKSLDGQDAYKLVRTLHVKSMKLKSDVMKTEEDWKKICMQTYPFIDQELSSNKDTSISAAKLAKMHDDMELYKFKKIESKWNLEEDKITQQRQQIFTLDMKAKQPKELTTRQDYDSATFGYKQLMIKLVFEDLLKDLCLNYNFELIYEFIKLFQADISVIKFMLIDTTHLKSNNYYLMAIIPKLLSLKVLKFYKESSTYSFGSNGVKFLQKALTLFNKNGGSLLKYEFGHNINSISEDFIYAQLKQMPKLQILKIQQYPLKKQDGKALGKYLSDQLTVKELDLSFTSMTTECAKEIADGLMRAKNLEIIRMTDNQSFSCQQILYNLAFSPKIKLIDMSNSCISAGDANWRQINESLYKLLSISGSIETILFQNTNICKYVTEDLSKAIGESVTLKDINIDYLRGQRGSVNSSFFKAIGMNAYKKGALRNVSVQRCTTQSINSLATYFWISEQDHELWFGDKNEARKMEKEQLQKKLQFNLEFFNLGESSLTKDSFKLKDYQIKTNPTWPKAIQFFGQTKVDSLLLNSTQLNQSLELWTTILGDNPVGPCNIRVLNLSKNNIGIGGTKILAEAFSHNQTIEVLDLSHNELQVYGTHLICKSLQTNKALKSLSLFKNLIDVDGCRSVRELLKVNKNIEYLDLGHNRIRQKGLEAIAEGLNHAENCKLKTLGIRMNFLNDDALKQFMSTVVFSNICALENLYVKFNNISQGTSLSLHEKLTQKKSTLYVDEFEKLVHINAADRNKRSLWVRCHFTAPNLLATGVIDPVARKLKDLGLVRNIKYRYGRVIKGKTYHRAYCFLEFNDEKSVQKSMRLIQSVNYQLAAYIVGSNTFVQMYKSKRKK